MKGGLSLAVSILIIWVTVLHAEVRIEITRGVDSVRPIAVVPFKWFGSGFAPEDIGSIVAADLRNSGKFSPLNYFALPQQVSDAKEINPTVWSAIGIDAVVIGQITPIQNGNYNVAYQLVDTGASPGTVLTQNSYKVDKHWLRHAGHATSDEVFETLTRIKGAFRTRIAYIVQTNSSDFPYELRIADYDGYNQVTIHRSLQPLMSPAWSPDGSKLAYVTFEYGRSALVIKQLSNGVVHKIISFPGHNGAPAFSPDGAKLAFTLSKTGSLNLYIMDIISGHMRKLTTDSHHNNTEPVWFPDSNNLAFTSDQVGHPQVYKININSGTIQRVTWNGLCNQDADISFDAKTMVMVSTIDGQQHIAKQDLVTGVVRTLSSTFLDETPSLAPNGTMVIYSSSHLFGSVLNLVSIDGRYKMRLPITDKQVKSPAWSPYL